MIKIETIEVAGFAAAFSALRLPFGKGCRSCVNGSAGHLSAQFVKDGDGLHPIWSKSEEIIIHPKDLDLMNTLVKRGTEHSKVTRGIMVWAKITAPIYWWCEMETYVVGHQRLSSESTMHVDMKGLSGEELQRAKAAIPMGRELTKVDMFSYQCLRNIVKQRHDHRLIEWHDFVDWVRSLPFSEELIFTNLGI